MEGIPTQDRCRLLIHYYLGEVMSESRNVNFSLLGNCTLYNSTFHSRQTLLLFVLHLLEEFVSPCFPLTAGSESLVFSLGQLLRSPVSWTLLSPLTAAAVLHVHSCHDLISPLWLYHKCQHFSCIAYRVILRPHTYLFVFLMVVYAEHYSSNKIT